MQASSQAGVARDVAGTIGIITFSFALTACLCVFLWMTHQFTKQQEESVPKYQADVCVFDGDDDFRIGASGHSSSLRRPSMTSPLHQHTTHAHSASSRRKYGCFDCLSVEFQPGFTMLRSPHLNAVVVSYCPISNNFRDVFMSELCTI